MRKRWRVIIYEREVEGIKMDVMGKEKDRCQKSGTNQEEKREEKKNRSEVQKQQNLENML